MHRYYLYLLLPSVLFHVERGGICKHFNVLALLTLQGEPPRLLVVRQMEGEKVMKDYFTQGISLENFQKKIPEIESALNVKVCKIEAGHDQQHVILHLLPGNAQIPEVD